MLDGRSATQSQSPNQLILPHPSHTLPHSGERPLSERGDLEGLRDKQQTLPYYEQRDTLTLF